MIVSLHHLTNYFLILHPYTFVALSFLFFSLAYFFSHLHSDLDLPHSIPFFSFLLFVLFPYF